MEETNPEFFKAYHAQLRVKEQERIIASAVAEHWRSALHPTGYCIQHAR
jgi:hypothetical protein